MQLMGEQYVLVGPRRPAVAAPAVAAVVSDIRRGGGELRGVAAWVARLSVVGAQHGALSETAMQLMGEQYVLVGPRRPCAVCDSADSERLPIEARMSRRRSGTGAVLLKRPGSVRMSSRRPPCSARAPR